MGDRRRARAASCGSVLLLIVLASCASGPRVSRAGAIYDGCDDAAAQRAWEQGRSAVAAANWDAAIESFRAVLSQCPNHVPAHLGYQDAATRVGAEAAATMRAYYGGLQPEPASPLVPYLRSRLADDDLTRTELLDEAIRRDDGFYYAYVDKAELWLRNDNTAEALDALQRAVSAKRDGEQANVMIARLFVKLGRVEEAEPHYRRYVAVRPDDGEATAEYIELLIYDLLELDRAEPLVDRLLASDPRDVDALVDRAAIAWRRGRHAEAARQYLDILRVEPACAAAALNYANLQFEQLADGGDEAKRRAWPRARAGYLYFLDVASPNDLSIARDVLLTAPYRLKRIDEFLGPAPANSPTPTIDDL